jgi:hypothetical protein
VPRRPPGHRQGGLRQAHTPVLCVAACKLLGVLCSRCSTQRHSCMTTYCASTSWPRDGATCPHTRPTTPTWPSSPMTRCSPSPTPMSSPALQPHSLHHPTLCPRRARSQIRIQWHGGEQGPQFGRCHRPGRVEVMQVLTKKFGEMVEKDCPTPWCHAQSTSRMSSL